MYPFVQLSPKKRTQVRTPKYRPFCKAMRGHLSKKSCYWFKTLAMVLNVKTMTQYFAKNSTKTCKKNHIVCRLRNLHYILKSWTRNYFSISSCIKVQFLIQRIKNQTLPVLDNELDVLHSK